MLSLSPDLIRR